MTTTLNELISFFEDKEIIPRLHLVGVECYKLTINVRGAKTRIKVYETHIEYYDKIKPPIFVGQENLIKNLHSNLKRINKETTKLREKIGNIISDGPDRSDFFKRYYYIQERIEEFEVIRDYKVDLIRLNDLYDFYGKEFDYV